jgi:dynein light chain 1
MTSCAEAIERFEEKTGDDATTATKVMLCGQMPPIHKMDGALGKLQHCTHLAIPSNVIERVGGIKTLTNLKILSLSRNQIKKLDGVEECAGSVEQLWVSYNLIDKLLNIELLVHLEVLYISNNKLPSWPEIMRLNELPKLEEILLQGNPIHEKCQQRGDFRQNLIGRLTKVSKLDGVPINAEERTTARDYMVAQQMLQRFGSLEAGTLNPKPYTLNPTP